jgi:hypothetical protein
MNLNLTILCMYPMWAQLNPSPDHDLFFENFDVEKFVNSLNNYFDQSRYQTNLPISEDILVYIKDYEMIRETKDSMKINLTVLCNYAYANTDQNHSYENFDAQRFVDALNEHFAQNIRYQVGFVMYIQDYEVIKKDA